MKLVEFLIDTKEKRACLFVLIVLLGLMRLILANALFVIPINFISEIESLFNFLAYAKNSFIGRLIYYGYTLTDYSFKGFVNVGLQVISLKDFVLIVFSIYLALNGYVDYIFRLGRYFSLATICLLVLNYVTSAIMIIKECQTMITYNRALLLIKQISMVFSISHIVIFLILLVFAYKVIKEYLVALNYKAVETYE